VIPIRCLEMVEIVTDWMEGALPEGERADIEEHLAICPHCVDYVAQMRTTTRVIGRLVDDGPAPDAARRRLLEVFRAQRTG
jgi:anti-sigma factor RsiW